MKLEIMGVYEWPVWKKGVCRFTWNCKGRETRYFIRGKVIITPSGGEPQEFGRGDLVTFPAGAYTWEVRKAVETYYDAE